MTSRSDAVLIGRAMRGRWGDLGELMAKAKDAASDLIDSEDTRAKAAGARLVVAMVSMQLKDEHKLLDVFASNRVTELFAIAADLGIDPSLIIDATVEAGGCATAIEDGTHAVDARRSG